MYDVRGAILSFTAVGPILDCAGLPLIIRNASKVTIDAPEIEFTGNLKVSGTVTALTSGTAVELGALRDKYNAHKHTGVSTGSGTSGQTDSAA
jgi:phage baseplate assembly protein gpV